MTDLTRLLTIAQEAVDVAHAIMLTRTPGRVTPKGDRDMASDLDYAIEQRLREQLDLRTPSIGFLGEEVGRTGAAGDVVWALDPIDGTANFIHGSPLCGISLALVDGNLPVLGVIDLPFLGARYSASRGGGADCDGKPIRVSSRSDLADAIVSVGDYAVGADAAERNEPRFAITRHLAQTVQRVRMHGSAAIDLAWLAAGNVDAVVMMSNKPWDTSAGVVIAREAGASVTDADGAEHEVASLSTVSANPGLLPRILEVLAEAVRP